MRSRKSEFKKYPGLYKVHGFSACSFSSSTTIMSNFGDIRNWSNNRLVDNNNDPDALFEVKNAEKRWCHLVHVEERWKAEEAERRKAAEAEERRKVAEARRKVEEEAKHKAAEEAAKKRVSVSTFSNKWC